MFESIMATVYIYGNTVKFYNNKVLLNVANLDMRKTRVKLSKLFCSLNAPRVSKLVLDNVPFYICVDIPLHILVCYDVNFTVFGATAQIEILDIRQMWRNNSLENVLQHVSNVYLNKMVCAYTECFNLSMFEKYNSSIKCIHFPDAFNQSIDGFWWLEDIRFNDTSRFNQPITRNFINIKSVKFGCLFNQDICSLSKTHVLEFPGDSQFLKKVSVKFPNIRRVCFGRKYVHDTSAFSAGQILFASYSVQEKKVAQS